MKYLCVVLFFLLFLISNYFDKLFRFVDQSIEINPIIINNKTWTVILLEMLQNSFFFDKINPDSVLLVNMIKNHTNGIIQTTKITTILIDLIVNNLKPCNIISIEKLYQAYRELGIASEEILDTYDFSIEVAHYLKADYVIYGIIYGEINSPTIELQLIETKTGEILFIVNKLIGYGDLLCAS